MMQWKSAWERGVGGTGGNGGTGAAVRTFVQLLEDLSGEQG